MSKTRVIVYLANKNTPYIRGEGVFGLCWDKGTPLHSLGNEEWLWETEIPFTQGSFKIFIHDRDAELGDNHPLYHGASMRIRPKFSQSTD